MINCLVFGTSIQIWQDLRTELNLTKNETRNSRKQPHINLTFIKPKIILLTYKNITILITVFVLD